MVEGVVSAMWKEWCQRGDKGFLARAGILFWALRCDWERALDRVLAHTYAAKLRE